MSGYDDRPEWARALEALAKVALLVWLTTLGCQQHKQEERLTRIEQALNIEPEAQK